jgi:hypothetical protein
MQGCYFVKMANGGWEELHKTCPGNCAETPDPSGYQTGAVIFVGCD